MFLEDIDSSAPEEKWMQPLYMIDLKIQINSILFQFPLPVYAVKYI